MADRLICRDCGRAWAHLSDLKRHQARATPCAWTGGGASRAVTAEDLHDPDALTAFIVDIRHTERPIEVEFSFEFGGGLAELSLAGFTPAGIKKSGLREAGPVADALGEVVHRMAKLTGARCCGETRWPVLVFWVPHGRDFYERAEQPLVALLSRRLDMEKHAWTLEAGFAAEGVWAGCAPGKVEVAATARTPHRLMLGPKKLKYRAAGRRAQQPPPHLKGDGTDTRTRRAPDLSAGLRPILARSAFA